MADIWGTIKHFLGNYVAHHATDNAIETITGSAVAKAADIMKTRFMGFGSNDEYLTVEAAVIAQDELNVDIKDIVRIFRLFSTFTHEERNKITNIIGLKDTQVIMTANADRKKEEKKEVKDKDKNNNATKNNTDNTKGEDTNDKKTKEKVVTPRVDTKNMRGAKMIQMLSKMTNAQIKVFLKGSGSLDTTSSNIKEMLGIIEEETGLLSTIESIAGDFNKTFFEETTVDGKIDEESTTEETATEEAGDNREITQLSKRRFSSIKDLLY